MSSRKIMALAAAGFLIAVLLAILLNQPHRPQPPAFQPAATPYAHAIYANGVIESDQADGSNLSLLPEVTGRVARVLVREGETVRAGQPLVILDDTVQRGATEQLRLQAEAAQRTLEGLRAQPRPEALSVAAAQLDQARASLRTLADQRDKIRRAAAMDARSVSRETLDSAVNAAAAGEAAVAVAQRQYDLVRAGAWSYDIAAQKAQADSLAHAHAGAQALLDKYRLTAPADGVVLSINAGVGGYVSPQGVLDPYTQANQPVVVLGSSGGGLQVRCYVDEILIHRLPKAGPTRAEMIVRGADVHIPLQFVRIQPFVRPKIELSDERQERVDLRVLPVIFRFRADSRIKLYPGQMVDVFISE